MKHILPIALAILAVGCGTPNVARLELSDVALRLEADPGSATSTTLVHARVPDEQELVYNNLCSRKECTPDAIRYTKLFRNAAVLALTLRTVEALVVESSSTPDARRVLEVAQARVPIWRAELAQTERELRGLRPEADFEGVTEQRAKGGINKALSQIWQTRARADLVEPKLAERVGDVQLEFAWPASKVVAPEPTAPSHEVDPMPGTNAGAEIERPATIERGGFLER